MDEELDSGFGVEESVPDIPEDDFFDIGETMDEGMDFSDAEEFSDYDFGDAETLDVDALLDTEPETDTAPEEPELIEVLEENTPDDMGGSEFSESQTLDSFLDADMDTSCTGEFSDTETLDVNAIMDAEPETEMEPETSELIEVLEEENPAEIQVPEVEDTEGTEPTGEFVADMLDETESIEEPVQDTLEETENIEEPISVDMDTPDPDIDPPEPGIDEPGIDGPAIDNPEPSIDDPEPGIDTPAPKIDEPGIDGPAIDDPEPGIDDPDPGIDTPIPGIDEPGIDGSAIDDPGPNIDTSDPDMTESDPEDLNFDPTVVEVFGESETNVNEEIVVSPDTEDGGIEIIEHDPVTGGEEIEIIKPDLIIEGEGVDYIKPDSDTGGENLDDATLGTDIDETKIEGTDGLTAESTGELTQETGDGQSIPEVPAIDGLDGVPAADLSGNMVLPGEILVETEDPNPEGTDIQDQPGDMPSPPSPNGPGPGGPPNDPPNDPNGPGPGGPPNDPSDGPGGGSPPNGPSRLDDEIITTQEVLDNQTAMSAMADYLSAHEYGPQDYDVYSKDPEWQQLNNDLLVELGREPIEYPTDLNAQAEAEIFGQKPAQNAMVDYLSEHNYGQEDYDVYSKDPEWQRLNNDLLAEMGRDPIDYSSLSDASLDGVTGEVVPRQYDEFEESVRLDNPEFYESGSFYTQGINEYGFTGTCGETSMATTINRVLGTNEFTENKVLDVAVQENLCNITELDGGGTTTSQFMDLYSKMNEACGGQLDVQCFDFENALNMEQVAQKLEEGCTLNVAVDSRTLWDLEDPLGSPIPESRATDHWITVTGVQRDVNGNINGFDVIDSGGGISYVDSDKYQAMCYGTGNLELTDPTCVVVSKKSLSEGVQQYVYSGAGDVITSRTTDVAIDYSASPEEIPSEGNVQVTDISTESEITGQIGPMKPNDCYDANGYTYRTDTEGRICSASGELRLDKDQIRNLRAQLEAGGDDRWDTDDGGHLIATIFGGSPDLDNMIAQDANINRSQFKQLENSWARDLVRGNRVIVNIEPCYGDDSQRPDAFLVGYTVIQPDGSRFEDSVSLTNMSSKSPEFQDDFSNYDDYDDSSMDTYRNLTAEERVAYEEAMAEKGPRIDEGRVFTKK